MFATRNTVLNFFTTPRRKSFETETLEFFVVDAGTGLNRFSEPIISEDMYQLSPDFVIVNPARFKVGYWGCAAQNNPTQFFIKIFSYCKFSLILLFLEFNCSLSPAFMFFKKKSHFKSYACRGPEELPEAQPCTCLMIMVLCRIVFFNNMQEIGTCYRNLSCPLSFNQKI